MSKTKSKMQWLYQREIGTNFSLGHLDSFHKTLYSSIQPTTSWDHNQNLTSATHGGVFNLEYSPDGSLLLAACEKKSILMFDPLCRKLIRSIDNAHDDCVNGARFLDQRMFATCSDDKTVALWDARNLKQKIRTLKGHSNWVKNIEYSPQDGLLLTSGFDGVIFTWDINNFAENNFSSKRVFQTNGLMRTRLSPDATKMLICTTSGYLILIHNLKLSTLDQDLAGFKPNIYRLMQLSQTTILTAASFTHLFSSSRKHNRVEFITDFPAGDDAEVISSLQVHPQGWCAMSRNVSNGEKSEWTCIHDIQERNYDEINEQLQKCRDKENSTKNFGEFSVEDLQGNESQQPSQSGVTSAFIVDNNNSNQDLTSNSSDQILTNGTWEEQYQSRNSDSENRRNSPRSNYGMIVISDDEDINLNDSIRVNNNSNEERRRENRISDTGLQRERRRNDPRRRHLQIGNGNFSSGEVELQVSSSSDVWEALVAIREARMRRESERDSQLPSDRRYQWSPRINSNEDVIESVNLSGSSHTVVIVGDRRAPSQSRQGNKITYAIPRNHRIHENIPRLTHYIQEPNVGSGYIKELCFSADGRLICSPFGYGVRLLSFSEKCQELSDCVPNSTESLSLVEVATNLGHSDIVVSTKFSPRHCLFVSGCLSGKIVWHQPVV